MLYQGAKDFSAHGAPTDGRRRFFQTSASPIPHPDTMSLKKSATKNGLNNEFMWINFGRPTQGATPQKPEEEIGVKKSSTAERPVERRSGLTAIQDSVESILNFKTHPNVEEKKVTGEGNLVSRILHDNDNLNMLYGKGITISKKLMIPGYEGVAFGRDAIPHPPTEKDVADSSEGKRTQTFADETSKILQRKTLLYSKPVYRPTGGTSIWVGGTRTDPRQLISILGDPLPYRRSDIANQESPSVREENLQDTTESWENVNRDTHKKGGHRKERFMDSVRDHALRKGNLDRDTEDIDTFYNKDSDEELIRRDPGEHFMLERLLDDNSPFFGTRDEKKERESTIKEIEKLTKQSSVLSKDYDFTGLPTAFSNMEVSEGELPSYDQIGDEDTNIRKSKVSKDKTKSKAHLQEKGVFTSEQRGVNTGPAASSFQPRPLKTKRSLHYHRRHHHRWRKPYLHVRSPQVSSYFDYPDEQDYEDLPRLPSYMYFHRFPIAQRWPRLPMSLMAERFVPFPHLPKISEFSPQPIERLERLPPPAPIPPAIIDREEAGNREAEPVDEFAPLPEPIPEPEPPPIPELPFIKEIPPIAEPQEPAPQNLDPKKTFDTGESNGGVKKSSSR